MLWSVRNTFKVLSLTLCLTILCSVSWAAFPSGWTRRAPIVIDATKVGTGGLTNYPLLLTAANFPTDAVEADSAAPALNGGGDLRFTSDRNGRAQLPCEVVSFVTNNNPALATAQVYVKVPTLSSTINTTIYVWWGKTGETQPAANTTYGSQSVWDANYRGVWHMEQDPSGGAPQILDSTQYGINGTSAGSMASGDLVAAQVGSGIDFDRTDDHLTFSNDSNLSVVNSFIMEFWSKPSQTSTLAEVFTKSSSTADNVGYVTSVSSNKWTLYTDVNGGTGFDVTLPSVTSANTSRFDHVAFRFNGAARVSLADPTYKTTHGCAITYNNKIYTFGGHVGAAASPVTHVQIYDPSNDTWAAGTAMTTARWGCAAAEYNGVVYVFGGATDATTASLKTEAYDIAGNSWAAKADLSAGYGGSGMGAVTIGTKIYVTYNDNITEYDPVGNAYANKTANSTALGVFPGTWTDGTDVYLTGGYNGGVGIKTTRKYDVSEDSWSTFDTDVPYNAWAPVVQVSGGYLYFGFGRSATISTVYQHRDLYRQNISTKAWTQLTSDTAEGNALFSGIVSGHLYVLGQRALGPDQTYATYGGYNSKFDLTSLAWETTASNYEVWMNGVMENRRLGLSTTHASTAIFNMGSFNNGAGAWYGGIVDEVRLSNVDRGAAYPTTVYNNTSAPGTFSTAGTSEEATVPSGGGRYLDHYQGHGPMQTPSLEY